jgi:hypothetical protein
MEEGGSRAREPSGEKSNEVWWLVMERIGVAVSKDVDLGVGS